MGERRAKRILLAALVWVVILLVLGGAYRLIFRPRSEARLAEQTGSSSRYRAALVLGADSFSGYAILRSPLMAKLLKDRGIQWTVEDDGADIAARLDGLETGRIQMAVFTIDSFLSAGLSAERFPASIVLVIDETRGADAVVAFDRGVGSLQDLNSPDARFVLTPGSPSEFLARVLIAHFDLPRLPDRWWIPAKGAADVYQQFREARKDERRAYVLWEPYVSKALQEPGAKVLLDTSKVRGLVVDVLVARRELLRDHPEYVQAVVESYLSAAYAVQREPDGLANLVIEDAAQVDGPSLSPAEAKKLVSGIWWKNTLENYAHFGLLDRGASGGVDHLEDMILSIMDVLTATSAVESREIPGGASSLFYDAVAAKLKSSGFHPGKKLNLVSGVGPGTEDLGGIREAKSLPALSDAQWSRLSLVAHLRVRPISFGRGSARIHAQGRRDLVGLADRLKAWPGYYLVIVGHSRAEGDPDANVRLARQRAEAAAQVLQESGISENRIRVDAKTGVGEGGAAQSVSFVVGQLPY